MSSIWVYSYLKRIFSNLQTFFKDLVRNESFFWEPCRSMQWCETKLSIVECSWKSYQNWTKFIRILLKYTGFTKKLLTSKVLISSLVLNESIL